MGPTETLTRFIADLRYDDLPPPAVDAAKVAIMDGVAYMLAGRGQLGVNFCSDSASASIRVQSHSNGL